MDTRTYTTLIYPDDRPMDFRQSVVSNLVYTYLEPEIDYVLNAYEDVYNKQSALVGDNTDFVFHRRTFRHRRAINEGSHPLHPSLHTEMQNYLTLDRNLKEMLTLMLNYVTSASITAKTKADLIALLPAHLHRHLDRVIAGYGPIYNALCWLPTPSISSQRIDRFMQQNKAVIDRMQVLELDLVTR